MEQKLWALIPPLMFAAGSALFLIGNLVAIWRILK